MYNNMECLPCHIKIDTLCVPLPCVGNTIGMSEDPCDESSPGVCDHVNNKCVECVKDKHCLPGFECKDNKCVPIQEEVECIPGFTDCGECRTCIDSKCVDISCPKGYVCIKDECYKVYDPYKDNGDDEDCVPFEFEGFIVCLPPELEDPGEGIDCPPGYEKINNKCIAVNPYDPNGDCVPGYILVGEDCIKIEEDPESGGDPGEGDPGVDCLDSLDLSDKDCKITASIQTEECCACEDYRLDFTTTYTNQTLKVRVRIIENLSPYNKLSDLNIDNILPSFGQIKVLLTVTKRKIIDGNIGPISQDNYEETLSYIYSDSEEAVFNNIPNVGDTIQIGENSFRITKIETKAAHVAYFTFPNNCSSKIKDTRIINTFSFPLSGNVLYTIRPSYFLLENLVPCRLPLLTLYKGDSIDNLDAIYSKYTTEFTLEEFPEVENLSFYLLHSDCGCKNYDTLNCDLSFLPSIDEFVGRAAFCDFEDLKFEIQDCGQTLVITEDLITNCKPLIDSDTEFALSINGSVVHTSTPTSLGVIFSKGLVFPVNTNIEVIRIEMLHSGAPVCPECVKEYTIEDFDIPKLKLSLRDTTLCDAEPVFLDYILENAQASEVTSYTLYGPNTTLETGPGLPPTFFLEHPVQAGVYSLHINIGSCLVEADIKIDEINIINIDEELNIDAICTPQGIDISNINQFDYIVNIETLSGGFVTMETIPPESNVSVPLSQGVYKITYYRTSSPNCTAEQIIYVACEPDNLETPIYDCENGIQIQEGFDYFVGNSLISEGTFFPEGEIKIKAVEQSTGFYSYIYLDIPDCTVNCEEVNEYYSVILASGDDIFLYLDGQPTLVLENAIVYDSTDPLSIDNEEFIQNLTSLLINNGSDPECTQVEIIDDCLTPPSSNYFCYTEDVSSVPTIKITTTLGLNTCDENYGLSADTGISIEPGCINKFTETQCEECEEPDPPCETCDFTFYGANRLFSLHIDGVEYPLNGSLGVECVGGDPVDDTNLVEAIEEALSDGGECSQNVTVTMEECLPFNPVEHDPNNCLDGLINAGDPIVRVVISGSGVNLTGVSWFAPGCQVPVTSSCD